MSALPKVEIPDTVQAAFLPGRAAPVTEARPMTWPDLSALLGRVEPGTKDGPAWMPASIEPGPRIGERVQTISALVLDVEADAVRDPDGSKRVIGPEPPPLEELAAELALIGWRAILHTTHSHAPEHPRYRAVFALSRPLDKGEVRPLGLYVASVLGIADAIDVKALEAARLFYLPRASRDRLSLFQHRTIVGQPLDVGSLLTDARRALDALKAASRSKAPPRSGRVIEAFNNTHEIGHVLETFGYTAKGRNRWLFPGSTSGLPGVRLLPESEPPRVFSSHAGDPLNDGRAHDAFDLWRILEHGGEITAAVRVAAEALGIDVYRSMVQAVSAPAKNSDDWPPFEPLPPSLPDVPMLDPRLLPAVLRPWLEDIAERVQCPLDYPAVVAIVALGAVVGRQIGIYPKHRDDWLVVPNLWGAIVGRPGVMKTPALTEAMRPLNRLESQARKDFEQAAQEHKADVLVAEASVKESKRRIDAAAKRGDLAVAREHALLASFDPEAPVRRRYLTQDPTVEKLGELLRDNPRGVLVSRDELVGWLRSLDREGHEGARAFYLEAWAGTGRYTYDRIGRGTIEIEAATVSVVGGIQPGPLEAYLRAAMRGGAGDDGLMQRIQLCVWPDVGRDWRNVDRWPDTAAKNAAFDLFVALDTLNPESLGADMTGDLPALRFDPEAQVLFDEWRSDLEQRLRDPDSPEPDAFVSHLAKFRSLAPSLALLYHLASTAPGPAVSVEAMAAAVTWCDYLEAHARRVYGTARTPELRAAREIERRLRRRDLTAPFTARDIYRNHWAGLDLESVSQALDYLESLGRVRSERTDSAGRPRVLWHVHPAVTEGTA